MTTRTGTPVEAAAVLAPPGRSRGVEEALVRPGAPLLYRVGEVMALLGLSRSVVFEQLRVGRLRSVRQGRARRVPAAAVLDYVRLLEREAAETADC